jgi:hypothetical protein
MSNRSPTRQLHSSGPDSELGYVEEKIDITVHLDCDRLRTPSTTRKCYNKRSRENAPPGNSMEYLAFLGPEPICPSGLMLYNSGSLDQVFYFHFHVCFLPTTLPSCICVLLVPFCGFSQFPDWVKKILVQQKIYTLLFRSGVGFHPMCTKCHPMFNLIPGQ